MRVFFHTYVGEIYKLSQYHKKIYTIISDLGYDHVPVDSEYIDNPEKLITKIEKGGTQAKITRYKECIKNLQLCDIFVIEVSSNSLSAGYLLHEALNNSRPVIALYHEGELPNLLSGGLENEKLVTIEYNSSNIKVQLERALELAKKAVDIRFNFFIPPQLVTYLNWTSSMLRISKSTYLRKLIMDDMSKNRDYIKLKKTF